MIDSAGIRKPGVIFFPVAESRPPSTELLVEIRNTVWIYGFACNGSGGGWGDMYLYWPLWAADTDRLYEHCFDLFVIQYESMRWWISLPPPVNWCFFPCQCWSQPVNMTVDGDLWVEVSPMSYVLTRTFPGISKGRLPNKCDMGAKRRRRHRYFESISKWVMKYLFTC